MLKYSAKVRSFCVTIYRALIILLAAVIIFFCPSMCPKFTMIIINAAPTGPRTPGLDHYAVTEYLLLRKMIRSPVLLPEPMS
ncbi:hypothetical protein BJX61DRAFT_513533 [Aspergillus egyptiacus]|nr:hypothetical protein BJX61DRAFT_513533 [Aspergillus egyptiacus]